MVLHEASQREITDVWDRINTRYGYDRFPNEMLVMHVFARLPQPSPKARALDVGFGSIHNLTMVGQRGYNLYGVEASVQALNDARKMAEERRLACDLRLFPDDFCLPFDAKFFDFVYSMGAIHHNLDIGRVKDEISRVLVPGGHMFLSFWSPDIDELGKVRIRHIRPGSDYCFVAETEDLESTLYPSARVVYPHADLIKKDFSTHFVDLDVRRTKYDICGNLVGFYYLSGRKP